MGRRVSFFCPSPAANPVGVEEGHRVETSVPFLLFWGTAGETLALNQHFCRRCRMPGYVLLDYLKMDHEERIRKAERDRMVLAALKADRRPSALKSLLLMLVRS